MAIERERKFLVNAEKLPLGVLHGGTAKKILGGYFTRDGVAIRVTHRAGGKSKVCFKSPSGEERQEFEYVIPEADALALLELCPTILTKFRTDFHGWEIDKIIVPHPDGPIWVAEWEEEEGKEPFPEVLPAWIHKEVTGQHGYSMQAITWAYGKKE